MIKVGEKLREERKKRGITLEEVSKATRIRTSFLHAIEEGKYEKLPGSSYAHGFVKNYLEYLNFPTREYMALFRREYSGEKQRDLMPGGMLGKESIPLRKFSLQQAFWLGGGILLVLILYVFFQYRAALFSPALTISQPANHAVSASQTILVEGTTDPNTAVTVNTLPAYVDANGKFTKEIPVFPGTVHLVIKAVNSFGKIRIVERDVVVKLSQ